MAKDDIVLSRKEHREIVRKLKEIRSHHSLGMQNRGSFAHTADMADLHENEGFSIHDCPQCSVITHCMEIERLITEKAAKVR